MPGDLDRRTFLRRGAVALGGLTLLRSPAARAIDAAGRGGSVRISASAGENDDRLSLGITPASGREIDPSQNGRADDGSMVESLRTLVAASGGQLRRRTGKKLTRPAPCCGWQLSSFPGFYEVRDLDTHLYVHQTRRNRIGPAESEYSG